MMKSNEYKAYGSIRKTKFAGACGVILALAMLGIGFHGTVSADEVKSNADVNNTTEVVKKEDVKTPEQAKVDDRLDKIASEAKDKGVDVNFKGEVEVTPEKTDEALKNVETKVNKAVEDHSKEVAEYNKKVAEVESENAKIQKENQAIETSNKNAKAVLTKDSTAKENNGVYTQTLTADSKTESTANSQSTSKGTVAITTGKGVNLISAELVSPSGSKQSLVVKDNKVDYNGVFSEKGLYKLNYSFASLANQKDQVVGTFTVDTESQDSTTRDKKVNAPMDLMVMVDMSPSYESRTAVIFPLTKRLLEDANPKSRVSFIGTTVNTVSSHTFKKDFATRWLNMDEANKFLDLVIGRMNQREKEGWSDKYSKSNFYYTLKDHPEYKIDEKYDHKEIEQFHKDLQNKNKVFDILQVTDGWSENEGMDISFAKYAKDNAKTFVSIVDAPASADFTTGKMKAVGHKDSVRLSPITDIDKIVSYFKEVAVETEVVKGEVKKSSTKDTKTDKFEPVSLKQGKNLLDKPVSPKNSKVDVEKIKVVKPVVELQKSTPKPVPQPVKETPSLPNTGMEASMNLMFLGLGGLTLAGSLFKKKEEK
ncbi:LPXTG cell wall anchor domain-containing protein [Streptococcus peroris]|uniref:LPXTG cell wall anchor domain-containing protein n=1 Tax=Streptococcus peroris TaxID=68891 RepID=UPI0039C31458